MGQTHSGEPKPIGTHPPTCSLAHSLARSLTHPSIPFSLPSLRRRLLLSPATQAGPGDLRHRAVLQTRRLPIPCNSTEAIRLLSPPGDVLARTLVRVLVPPLVLPRLWLQICAPGAFSMLARSPALRASTPLVTMAPPCCDSGRAAPHLRCCSCCRRGVH